MSPPNWTRSWRQAKWPCLAARCSGVTSLVVRVERMLGFAVEGEEGVGRGRRGRRGREREGEEGERGGRERERVEREGGRERERIERKEREGERED